MQIQIQESINTYVVVKTGVGLGTAGITAIILFIFGIDLWFTWALLTFILNYVPYIGSLIATIPPLILGFVTLSPVGWFIMLILLVSNQQLWGSIIERSGQDVRWTYPLSCCCLQQRTRIGYGVSLVWFWSFRSQSFSRLFLKTLNHSSDCYSACRTCSINR